MHSKLISTYMRGIVLIWSSEHTWCAQQIEVPPRPQIGTRLNFIVLWIWDIIAILRSTTT